MWKETMPILRKESDTKSYAQESILEAKTSCFQIVFPSFCEFHAHFYAFSKFFKFFLQHSSQKASKSEATQKAKCEASMFY